MLIGQKLIAYNPLIIWYIMQDRMGMTTVLNAAGVDKDRFIDYTDKNPATYKVRLKGSSNRYHAAHVKKTRKYILECSRK